MSGGAERGHTPHPPSCAQTAPLVPHRALKPRPSSSTARSGHAPRGVLSFVQLYMGLACVCRRRAGRREDNRRQIHEGHCRLHQRPGTGLGLLRGAVVAGAGHQHALVHPLKDTRAVRH